MSEVNIDAKNKSLGRLASEIAVILMGKNKVNYLPYKITGDKVKLENVESLKLTGKKEDQKIYYHHTGYPGGLKERKVSDLGKKEVLIKAVFNMLPKNKLRNELMKRLIIE